MQQAAVIADRWRMDIVAVLEESDPLRWAARVAGHRALLDMEREAAEARRKK